MNWVFYCHFWNQKCSQYQSAISFEPTHAHNVHLNFTPTDDVLFISKRFKSFFNFYNLVKLKLFSNLIKWPKDSYVEKVLNINWIPKVAFYVEISMSHKIYFILFLYALLFVNQIISVLMLIQIVFLFFQSSCLPVFYHPKWTRPEINWFGVHEKIRYQSQHYSYYCQSRYH